MPFKFLPSVFIHRFIVQTHDFAQVKDMWQSGIYLQHQGQYAVVEAQYHPERKIIIRYPAGAENLVGAIREELEAINQQTSVKAEAGELSTGEKFLQGFDRLREKQKSDQPIPLSMKKEVNIFISYSSKDRDLRGLLVNGLREHLHHRKGFNYTLWADDGIDLGRIGKML